MLKIIKYNLIIFFIFCSNKALAQFVENHENDITTENIPATKAIDSITEITTFFFAIIFVFSIIGFIFSGVRFMAAGGDEGTLDSAHKTWIASLTGLTVSLVGYIAISLLRIIF